MLDTKLAGTLRPLAVLLSAARRHRRLSRLPKNLRPAENRLFENKMLLGEHALARDRDRSIQLERTPEPNGAKGVLKREKFAVRRPDRDGTSRRGINRAKRQAYRPRDEASSVACAEFLN